MKRFIQGVFFRIVGVISSKSPTLLDTNIHGTHYYECGDLLRNYALSVGQELKLVREQDNTHDVFAIAVYTLDDNKLGYVPHRHNRVIANLIDQHLSIKATIVNIVPHAWDPVVIRVYLKH